MSIFQEFMANNSLESYFTAIAVFVALLVLLKIFQTLVLSRLNKLAVKSKNKVDDLAIEIFKSIKPPFYVLLSLYIGFRMLFLTEFIGKAINVLFLILIVYEVIRAISRIIDFAVDSYIAKDKADDGEVENLSLMRALKVILKAIVWISGFLVVLSNLGIDIWSLVAGLGIGGLAIALALQSILEDVFSSFSIYLDKPFKVGDYIVIGENSGTVKNIGLKTTRLTSLTGEELIIPNKELTATRVQNFERLQERRAELYFGVTYNTAQEKLEKIPNIVEEVVKQHSDMEFIYCYFSEFADSSLNYESAYNIKTTDYTEYVKAKERVNLAINKRFKEESIEFAFPTQTVILEK